MDASARTSPIYVVGALLAVFALSVVSVRFAPPSAEVAAWWPAAGFAVLLATRFSGRKLAWVLLALFVVSVFGNYVAGRMPLVALGFGLANAVEAFVGAAILRDLRGRVHGFDSVAGLVRVLIAAVACGFSAAVLAGITVVVVTDGSLLTTINSVLPAHAAAVLLITPLGLPRMRSTHRAGAIEAIAQWVFLLLAVGLVFGANQNLPVTFVPYALFVWGATRVSIRAFQIQMLVTGLAVAVLSRLGLGPFGVGVFSPETSASLVQVYLLTSGLVFFSLAVLVAAQRQYARALRSSEELFRETFNNALVGMAVAVRTDAGLRVDRANRVAGSILNLTGDTDGNPLDGNPFRVFTEKSRVALENATPLEVRGGPASWRGQLETVEGRAVDVYVAPLTSVEPARRYAIQFADVSEKALAERALLRAIEYERKAGARLRSLDSMKDSLISSVSHELRTPLAGILGYSEMLLDGDAGPLTPGQADMVAVVERSGQRLSRIVEDLLTMSRIETSKSRADTEWLDPSLIVRTVCTELRPLAEAKNQHLAVTAQVSGDAGIRVVPDDLHAIVTNLVGNAIKYTPDGGSVRAVVREQEDRVHVEVIDTGVGIAVEDHEKVFDQFYRSNTRDDAPAGTGLGLAIVDALVRRNRAAISVESELGIGTRMTVSFPVAMNPAAVEDSAPSSDRTGVRAGRVGAELGA